ncbi:hypothetical protein S100390_v1c07670 [Spiroplasma sp. NBRC 100390]|uniref:MATE family efflux transporter n=1 Tax=unclassified Spiroplasma TaxID=2637901 RepID=UPI00089288ED|nr:MULTISPECIES: MATE family efflux transporter [unclassified Spiroplasma]AOX44103.1 hypothetical protein STU14_v1c07670 [Spiroplasma sp. TU-14]APE13573.1 hypothetical protein S100390_v1c07670 [Spiroplasma sp. NBRC 100390]
MKTVDLTIREQKLRYAKPWLAIAYFSIPTVLIMLIQGFYNIIDKELALQFAALDLRQDPWYIQQYNLITKHNVTSIPLKDMQAFINVATQYTTQIYSLLWSFSLITGMGCAINFSLAYGRRDLLQMREIAGNGFSCTILFSIVSSLLMFCLIFPPWHAVFITSQMGGMYNNITNHLAWEYSYPMLLTTPLMFLSYYFVSLLRNEGRTNYVLLLITVSVFVNMGAGIFFMKVCHLKMEGAMLGTVVAWLWQIIVGFIIVFCSKSSYSQFKWQDVVKIKWSNITAFFKAGLSNFISNFALVVSSYLSTVLVVLLPNQEQYNGVSVLQELLSALNPWITLILSAGIGLTQGARTVIVYNYGAQKYHRIWQVLKITSYLLIIWFCLMLLLVIIFNREMMLMFAFPIQYVEKYKWWLVLCVCSYPFCATTFICFTLYQGINKTTLASVTTSFRAIFIAIPMICLGYGVSIWFNNSIYYFIFMGAIDFVSSLCLIPFLCYSWKKYHLQLIDHPDNFIPNVLKIKVQK